MAEQFTPLRGLELSGYLYLGRGPSAINATDWPIDPALVYRCAQCGKLMAADHDAPFRCKCGAMTLDAHSGKFASALGSDNVLVYRMLPLGFWRSMLRRVGLFLSGS